MSTETFPVNVAMWYVEQEAAELPVLDRHHSVLRLEFGRIIAACLPSCSRIQQGVPRCILCAAAAPVIKPVPEEACQSPQAQFAEGESRAFSHCHGKVKNGQRRDCSVQECALAIA